MRGRQREGRGLRPPPMLLPLADASGAYLALDRPPEPPGPLGVSAFRGDDRELGGGEHDVHAGRRGPGRARATGARDPRRHRDSRARARASRHSRSWPASHQVQPTSRAIAALSSDELDGEREISRLRAPCGREIRAPDSRRAARPSWRDVSRSDFLEQRPGGGSLAPHDHVRSDAEADVCSLDLVSGCDEELEALPVAGRCALGLTEDVERAAEGP